MNSAILIKMDKDTFYRELIYRYRKGVATDEELEAFHHLVQSGKIDVHLINSMDEQLHKSSSRPMRLRFGYAATIALCCALGFIFFYYYRSTTNSPQPAVAITAAKDQAILTLADGKKIRLDSSSMELGHQHEFKILRGKETTIDYKTDLTVANQEPSYNEISTPKGGKYQVILADGTRVWLNADSKLKFPVRFSKKQRDVELTGEAYFEVNQTVSGKKKAFPFIVHTPNQNILVMGTSFNIKAYQDEPEETSTLVTGRVKVIRLQETVQLEPGQQASVNKDKPSIAVRKADLEEVLAWKNGDFIFNDTPIQEIMKQLARWYNIDVETSGIENNYYSGYIPRNVSLQRVLDMMERTGELKFEINNNRIHVKN